MKVGIDSDYPNSIPESYSPFAPLMANTFLERVAGIEPASSVWKTEIITIIRYPQSSKTEKTNKKLGIV